MKKDPQFCRPVAWLLQAHNDKASPEEGVGIGEA